MKDRCLTPEEIIETLHAGPEDARRRHLETCGWCQGLRASLELFDDTGALPPGADPTDAELRLGAFLEHEVAREDGETPPQRGTPIGRGRVWWRGRTTAVLAAAAVLVIAVGLHLVTRTADGDGLPIKLRGRETGSRQTIRLAVPELRTDGSVYLAWNSVDGASAYEVQLLDGDQALVEVLPVGLATDRRLRAAELASLQGRPRPHFVRIVALGEGDPIARSLPRVLPD
jgi:hypothetical protein